jgi:hypothetical protein
MQVKRSILVAATRPMRPPYRRRLRYEQVTFDTHWNNAVSDFEKVRAPIPYEQLHNHALELLRSRIVAKDEAAAQ